MHRRRTNLRWRGGVGEENLTEVVGRGWKGELTWGGGEEYGEENLPEVVGRGGGKENLPGVEGGEGGEEN